MPHDLPKWKSVSDYFYKWRDDGTWERMLTSLRAEVRRKAGRAPEPTLGLLDSQSVKTTEVGGADRGFDAGKKVKGRKRHILVDIMGLLLVVMISSAAMQDRDSVPTMLAEAKSSFKTLRKVVVDTAYRGDVVDSAVAATGIPVEVVARPQAAKGWVLLPKRWVVERSFGWINRSRRLSKDYERSTDSGEAWIRLSFVQLMARRLA